MESIKILKLQSADVPDEGATAETNEVLTFVDTGGDVEDCGYSYNPIASASATQNTSLAKFLSRPTLVDTRTWATSDLNGYLGTTIEPWYLFLNNSVIKNKLVNYAFLRAKLCVKIIVNATPFHYGCLRVAYEPNVNAANTGDRVSKIRTNLVSTLPYVIPLSQLPGMWVYPADDTGGELHVPFFKSSNWLKLNVKEPAKTMGAMYYYVAFPLSVASATASSTLTIDTFVWLEDVELSGSTAELTLQGKDEYDGPISKVASAVAAVSSKMESVPVIGKFARATTIGASAMASIASMFGFTNTPIIDGVPARIPMPGPHLASAEISAPIQKLTLDPKQELSVDPTLHGLDSTDEMAILNIVSKNSTLVMDGWATTDAVGTVIFNANVSPMLFGAVDVVDGSAVTQARRVYHTPMSYLGMMFTHWRGDIIFEVDVICTKFHKGRLKIAWDPLGSGGTAALPENTVFTTILDIGENNKATFRVPFHQAYAWLRTRAISRTNWSPGNALPVNDLYDNGLFVISVLTPLISPVTPQNVGVKISVYAAKNFEFANPRSSLGQTSGSPPPSFFAVQGKDVVDVESTEVALGDIGDQHPQRYALNFGEHVASLRNVLHRMSIYDISTPGDQPTAGVFLYAKSYSRLPPMFGFDPNGLSTAAKQLGAGSAPFNYTPTHPITYVSMLYGAFRGGVNYTANVAVDLFSSIGDIKIERITDDTNAANRRGRILSTQAITVTNSNVARYLNSGFGHGTAGLAFTNTQTNGAVTWNAPHKSGVNWNYTDPTYAITGNAVDQTDSACTQLDITFKASSTQSVGRWTSIPTFAGTGVDFTCLWFLCCPTLDYYTNLPVSA